MSHPGSLSWSFQRGLSAVWDSRNHGGAPIPVSSRDDFLIGSVVLRAGQWPPLQGSRSRASDTLGKLGMLTRGAQSERPKERRQSGVVDIDGNLRPEVH
jgi:hypothetical protein